MKKSAQNSGTTSAFCQFLASMIDKSECRKMSFGHFPKDKIFDTSIKLCESYPVCDIL